jgi:hypothetical protein
MTLTRGDAVTDELVRNDYGARENLEMDGVQVPVHGICSWTHLKIKIVTY